ncbi:hypothetical protein BC834DRAFT_819272 [Gloeopeniophorella convolvens]|nr:hypothetical protein BC834DRAFT_819272 [Gloeopeniophorella convolvens]
MSNADEAGSSTGAPHARGRGRGRSRGGLGKFLRARGRRGGGRPAEFRERLVLEDEQYEEFDEEEAAELRARYSRRALGTNADRYEEPEPELGPDGRPITEPEVDLSAFLARQRLEDPSAPLLGPPTADEDDDDVDHSLAHMSSNGRIESAYKKGKAQQIEWDASLEEMRHEINVAQAQSDLKERFRASATRQMGKTATRERVRRQGEKPLKQAPPLPSDSDLPVKAPKAEMEDFLDDLLG